MFLKDGSGSIFLNTHGKNENETPKALVQFLKYTQGHPLMHALRAGALRAVRYVRADLAASMDDYEDEFVKRLQTSVQRVKESRRMEEKFMLLEEMLRDERAEGRAEGKAEGKAESILELLEDYGPVPEYLKERILSEMDLDTLRRWHKLSARIDSVEAFVHELETEDSLKISL